MKGTFNFNLSQFPPNLRATLLGLAQGHKSFPITVNETLLFLARIDKLILESKLTNDIIEIEYGILNHSITEPPFYKWVKDKYPDIAMEYALVGTDDLEKEEQ